MLRKVRFHIQGSRLHDALTNSPLTIVYQCIGNVKAAQLVDSLRAEVSESEHCKLAVPISFRVKNSFAEATGRPDVSPYLQATNVLIGWELSVSTSDSGMPTSRQVFRASDRLTQLLATQDVSLNGRKRQPPQRMLSALIKASLGLASKYPIAPLVGFFHGQRIRLSDLARWADLDDATVYGELVVQLDAVPHGLVRSLAVGDMAISDLLEGQAASLLACLEARKSKAGAGAGLEAVAAVGGEPLSATVP